MSPFPVDGDLVRSNKWSKLVYAWLSTAHVRRDGQAGSH